MADVRKVIIIGSGPAGLTAAIYTARANLAPLVFEGIQPGGQLTTTTEVENYPGFPEGIEGPELMDIMRKQAERFGSEHRYDYVDKVDFSKRPFSVFVGGEEHLAEAVIIATGASARYMDLPGEDALKGRGLSACATCDGFFFRDKDILVVGGGDSAMEEATFLTKFASSVTLVHRRDAFRASKIMQERALANPKIKVRYNAVIAGYRANEHGQLAGVLLRDTATGEEQDLPTDGVFMAIGHDPNTEFLQGAVDLDDKGYIKLHEHTMTNVEGVFACGDVADTRYRQAITAAGSGCAAAIDTEKWLEEKGIG